MKTVVLLSGLLALSCLTSGGTRTVYQDVRIPVDLMGMVHAGYANNSGKIDEEYVLLNEMGVRWMLRDFSWEVIQPEKGVWDWSVYDKYVEDAEKHDKKILGLLYPHDTLWIHGDYNKWTRKYACGHTERQVKIGIVAGDAEIAAFCEYARETALRYKGRVGAWAIWNEPNMSEHFWNGTPKEFFALTKAAAAAIREADPDAVIIGGSLNPGADNAVWTRGLFTSGAMDQVDYIAYHPYARNAEGVAQAYISFRNYVSQYGFGDKVWITEIGYPLDKGHGGYDTKVREAFMSEMTVKTITLLAAAGAQRIFWYEMFDYGAHLPPGDSEAWFGLVDFDTFKKKGGGEAYQLCSRNFPGKTMRSLDAPNFIEAFYFQGEGNHSLVIWDNKPSRPRQIRVTLPGKNIRLWDIARGVSVPVDEEASVHTLQKGASLLFFTWENDISALPVVSGD